MRFLLGRRGASPLGERTAFASSAVELLALNQHVRGSIPWRGTDGLQVVEGRALV